MKLNEYSIGKRGIFTSYDDKVWGEKYGGKEATIIKLENVKCNGEYFELKIMFDDGQELTIGNDEFRLLDNND